jgi:hypothetical protein
VDVRRELARTTNLDRPWQLLANRQALARAIIDGAALASSVVSHAVAVAAVDGRVVERQPGSGAVAESWNDALRFLAAASGPRPAALDEGLLRGVHWLLHRHVPAAAPGRLRAGADLRLAPPPPGADDVDAAIWTTAAVRRADPFTAGNVVVAHAVELLLLGQADQLAPWYAGRPSPAGDPRMLLQSVATAHLDRCREGEQRWFSVGRWLAGAGLPDRMAGPCWDAAAGLPLTNASYRSAAAVVRRRPISEQQASRDLRALVDRGLLQTAGRTRDRTYRWSA